MLIKLFVWVSIVTIVSITLKIIKTCLAYNKSYVIQFCNFVMESHFLQQRSQSKYKNKII